MNDLNGESFFFSEFYGITFDPSLLSSHSTNFFSMCSTIFLVFTRNLMIANLTLGRLLNFSSLNFWLLKMEMIVPSYKDLIV